MNRADRRTDKQAFRRLIRPMQKHFDPDASLVWQTGWVHKDCGAPAERPDRAHLGVGGWCEVHGMVRVQEVIRP